MKKTLLTLAMSACAATLFAQGTVDFNNRNTGAGFFAPIYGTQPGNAIILGNSAAGLPAGAAVYSGALLTGSGYRAVLFAANGTGVDESSLQAASASSTFRTGTSSGAFAGIDVTLTGVPKDAAIATAQVRAWDNTSGLYPTWAAAEVAWLAGTIAAGKSGLFTISAIGGDFNTSPQPVNMRSFNIYYVPEPSTFVLAGLGAAGLLIFRRRK